MSVPAKISGESSRGGLAVVMTVFCMIGFLLTVGVHVLQLQRRAIANPQPQAEDPFDPTPIDHLIQPRPQLQPNEVVEIQVNGLADADISTGIQQCFVFASPSNRLATGPLPRFAAMVRSAPYRVLMHHQVALIGSPSHDENHATVIVTLLDEFGAIQAFQFLLSKQHGDGVEGCWMTEAVVPLKQMPDDPIRSLNTAGFSRDELRVSSMNGFALYTRLAHG